MSVTRYAIRLLRYEDVRIRYDDPLLFSDVLKAWRHSHETSDRCTLCKNVISFRLSDDDEYPVNFRTCCGRFYFRPTSLYLVETIALKTDGYLFALPSFLRLLGDEGGLRSRPDFLAIPDPVYWQVAFTLVLDRVVKFVTGSPMTRKSPRSSVLPPSKAAHFFRQMQEAPLNHGSLIKRSCGKNTFFRQYAFGKRCELSARAMIVPDSSLRPNEISIPEWMGRRFGLEGRWLILNRMPSLQPENFVALRVARLWKHACFGVPLEILEQINGDFDGDECNLYFLRHPAAQAECELLLDSEKNATGSVLDLKLHPSREMQIAYHLLLLHDPNKKLETVFFSSLTPLPPRSIHAAFRTVSDLEGSRAVFECYDAARRLYLDHLQNETFFGFSVEEMRDLVRLASEAGDFETFSRRFEFSVEKRRGPLWHQVFSGAKGNPFHVYLMVGSIDAAGRQSSFWRGLDESEAVPHARASAEGLSKAGNVSGPGYDYAKTVHCQQGVHVDYAGRLVDGGRGLVVERDALDAVAPERLLHPASFRTLVEEALVYYGGGGGRRRPTDEAKRRKAETRGGKRCSGSSREEEERRKASRASSEGLVSSKMPSKRSDATANRRP